MSYPPHNGYPDDGYGQPPQSPTGYGGYQYPQHPGYDPNAGYPQQQGYGNQDPNAGYQQGGYQAWPGQPDPGAYQAGPGGFGGAPPPQKKSNMPMIVLSVVAGVLVISVAATLAIVGLSGSDEPEPGTASGSESESSTPSQSSSSSSQPEVLTDITYLDLKDDWSGSSDKEVQYVGGLDYNKCTTFIADEALTDQGCETAVEISFEGEDGELKAAVFYLVMAEEEQASDIMSTVGDEQMRPRKLGFIEGANYAQWLSDSHKNVTVLTYVTATDEVDKSDASDYLNEIVPDMTKRLEELA